MTAEPAAEPTAGALELGERFAVAALAAICRDIRESAHPIGRSGDYRVRGRLLEDLGAALEKLEGATRERMFPGVSRHLRELAERA